MSTAIDNFNSEARRALIAASSASRFEAEEMLRSLAAEIAMDINEFDAILANHGVTYEQWQKISRMPRFQTLLSEASVQWGSTASAALRIRARSESMLELALPHLFKALIKDDELTPSKVRLVEALMKGGGIGVEASAKGGEGVSITINMDAQRQPRQVIIDHEAQDM